MKFTMKEHLALENILTINFSDAALRRVAVMNILNSIAFFQSNFGSLILIFSLDSFISGELENL